MSAARRLIDLTDADLTTLVRQLLRDELAAARPAEQEVLDTREAAKLLGIHPGTLQKMTRDKLVPVHFIGNVRRYKRSELLRCLENKEG